MVALYPRRVFTSHLVQGAARVAWHHKPALLVLLGVVLAGTLPRWFRGVTRHLTQHPVVPLPRVSVDRAAACHLCLT